MNGIFKLGWYDIVKGVAVAIGTAIITALYNLVILNGFDFYTMNWILVGHSMTNIGIIAGVGYLFTNLLSTNRGSVLNVTPNNPAIPPTFIS